MSQPSGLDQPTIIRKPADPVVQSGVELVPEATTHAVRVDGHIVPLVSVAVADDGQWHIILDGRFGMVAAEDEAKRWLWFLANAMAVAGGYTSFGPFSRPRNPWG